MRWLLACVLLTMSTWSVADGTLYGEVQIGGAAVGHSELDFFPALSSFSIGAFVLPGIGIDFFADTGLTSGDDEDLTLEITDAFGAGIRFQSPSRHGTQGYVVLGAVSYSAEQSFNLASEGSSTVSEDFTGVRVSVGVMQRLNRFPNLQLTGEYRHYNAGEPLRVDALLIGLRFNTP